MTDQPPTPDQDPPLRIRPFADVLQDLSRGQLHDDASTQLQTLVQAVQANAKKGTLTLTIEVAPMKGDQSAVMLAARVVSKPPAGEMPVSVFFADDAGNLVRDDPRQMHLPLREASTPTPARTDLRTAT